MKSVFEEEQTIAETIIWLAHEKMKLESYQNINSAVHGVLMDVSQFLMSFMNEHKKE